MGRIFNWLKSNHNAGDPSRTTPTAEWCNRVANILENMTMTGGHIEKPKDSEGKNWKFIVDGSSDETPPSGYVAPWNAPSDYYWNQYTVGSPTVETTEFRTTNNVTVGGLRADDAEVAIGTDTDKFQSAYFKNLTGSSYGPNFNITPSSIGTAFTAGYTDASSIISMFGCGASYGLNIVDTTNSRVVQLCNSANAIQTTGDADIGGLVKISGAQVLTSPGAVVNNAATAVGTGTNGGYGFASLGEFNTFIANHNALVGTVNALLARVRLSTGHGLIVG